MAHFLGYSIVYKGHNLTRFNHQKNATHMARPEGNRALKKQSQSGVSRSAQFRGVGGLRGFRI